MPTYDYRCRECGRDFEVFQRMSDKPGASCPDCGHGAERLISGGAGFLFKGDGFYITDHRSEEYRKRARAEAGGGEAGGAAGEAEANGGSGASGETAGSAPAKGKGGSGDGVSSTSGTGSGKGSADRKGD